MITGTDISYYQQTTDFTKMKQAADFVILRGYFDGNKDTLFDTYYAGAGAVGLLRGVYHFVNYTKDAKAQAGYLAGLYNQKPTELPPVCDFEFYNPFGSITREKAINFLYTYMSEIEAKTGRVCMLYTNPNWILNLLKPIPQWLMVKPLWVAHWGSMTAPVIGEFPAWTFWQHTDKGTGADYGVSSGNIDLDRFNGSKADLYRFAGKEVPTEEIDLGNGYAELVARMDALENWKNKPLER